MTSITESEWARVQEALCTGGLRECINTILSTHSHHTPAPVLISDENRRIIEQAYDDGVGGGITLVADENPPWFVGRYEDFELCEGIEHDGVLYTIVHASGGGLVSVVVGKDLIANENGATFRSMRDAKAYVQGCTAE